MLHAIGVCFVPPLKSYFYLVDTEGAWLLAHLQPGVFVCADAVLA